MAVSPTSQNIPDLPPFPIINLDEDSDEDIIGENARSAQLQVMSDQMTELLNQKIGGIKLQGLFLILINQYQFCSLKCSSCSPRRH